MTDEDLIQALEAQSGLPFAGPFALANLQPRGYRLTAGGDTFFLKWVAADDRLGANELAVNATWLPAATIRTPRLVATMAAGGGRIACWEWVEGPDLRGDHRHRLPDAFAALGRFHRAARHERPVRASPLTDDGYPSVRALVAAERDRLAPLVDDDARHPFARLLARLEQGYPTLVHGDVHPGNILHADGGLTFVDWSMARPGLNLLDLEYIESVSLVPPIRPGAYMVPAEAPAILDAYCAAAGLAHVDPLATHLAVVAWQLACGYGAVAERPDRAADAAIWRSRLHQAVAAAG